MGQRRRRRMNVREAPDKRGQGLLRRGYTALPRNGGAMVQPSRDETDNKRRDRAIASNNANAATGPRWLGHACDGSAGDPVIPAGPGTTAGQDCCPAAPAEHEWYGCMHAPAQLAGFFLVLAVLAM